MSRVGIGDTYVVPIDSHFDGDGSTKSDCLFASSLQRVSTLKDYKFLLVMLASDRSLSSVILHENICGSDWPKIKQILRDILVCLREVHSQGRIHGDIKPLNVMRLSSGQMCLIDMDTATVLSDICGSKISSCYIPPEMVIINCDNTHEISRALLASVSYDMWSLGCVLYYLCTGETVFQSSTSDSLVDDASFHTLSTWSSEVKNSKLSKITDKSARNLVSQLLHKDHTKRPDTSHALAHPFLTGRVVGRMPGDIPKYDVFLSYRQATELALVETLHYKLTAHGLHVFWDKRCLADGKNWEEGFAAGLCDSGIFVPVISRAATKSHFEKLAVDSSVDNVLLEHRLSLELEKRELITHIYPVYVGDTSSSGNYTNYFASCAVPNASDIQVKKLEESAISHLDNLGLGSPLLPDITVKGIVEKINKSSGGFIEGDYNDLDGILSSLANKINSMSTQKRLLTSDHDHSDDVKTLREELASKNQQLSAYRQDIVDRDEIIKELRSELGK